MPASKSAKSAQPAAKSAAKAPAKTAKTAKPAAKPSAKKAPVAAAPAPAGRSVSRLRANYHKPLRNKNVHSYGAADLAAILGSRPL